MHAMAKQTKVQRQALVRVQGAVRGQGLLRRMEAHGSVPTVTPRRPTALHQAAAVMHAPKAKKAKTTKHTTKRKGRSGTSSHHTLTDADVVQIVLAALQGGALRLAVEDIAQQIYWQLQAQQQSAMQQGGSYQRQGGF